MSVAKLMTALMNDHNGPQETNRVHYNKKDATWVIRPPRNYKLDSSLPPHMAIIDRRQKARLEYEARVLSTIKQKARNNKIAEQLIKNDVPWHRKKYAKTLRFPPVSIEAAACAYQQFYFRATILNSSVGRK